MRKKVLENVENIHEVCKNCKLNCKQDISITIYKCNSTVENIKFPILKITK